MSVATDQPASLRALAEAVRTHWPETPRLGILLGSGLASIARELERPVAIPYADLPGFLAPTALGHRGVLTAGLLAGQPALAFQGRFHLYEGYCPQQAALPIRLLQALRCPIVVVTNAAGGVNPRFAVGDVMAIDDHINLMFANPLVGPNDDRLGPRFPDMSAPYDRPLQREALAIAHRAGFHLHRGVYVAMRGPTYETRAEYRMCRLLGGDAVGMSTVPEVIAARHAGMRVLGLSIITNVGRVDPEPPSRTTGESAGQPTTGHDVAAAATRAAHKVATVLRGLACTL